MVGIDPGPFTLRDLMAMANARLETEWDRTAMLVAKIHNVNVRREDQIRDLASLNPFRAPKCSAQPTLTLKDVRKLIEKR